MTDYVALLRGINVGGNHKVEMKGLKALFESLGCTEVSTYINSGNVLFRSGESRETLYGKMEKAIGESYDFPIPLLIKTAEEMRRIAEAVPKEWMNDREQKTDVAYLFPDADSEVTASLLPVKREFIDLRYVPGAVIWHVTRENLNRSRLSNAITHAVYRSMTVRNVNTARFLAGLRG